MLTNQVRIKHEIEENAATLCELRARIKETFKWREQSPFKRREWESACREFHARYKALSFPCDYVEALQKIPRGDPHSVECALCFVEVRPYFFRSGYMYKDLIRKLTNAPLFDSHRERRDAAVQAYSQWRASKQSRR